MSSHASDNSNKIQRRCCEECDGSLPWEEENPHADPANGTICSTCGHFYGFPAFYKGSSNDDESCLLYDYCYNHQWEKAGKRIAYVPREAEFVSSRFRYTALFWAIYQRAPVELIRALVGAFPEALSIHDTDGTDTWPIWIADSTYSLDERPEQLLDIVQIFVQAHPGVLRQLCNPVIESYLSDRVSGHDSIFHMAAEIPDDCSIQEVMAYTPCQDEVDEHWPAYSPSAGNAYRLASVLVQADSHADGNHSGSSPHRPFRLLHAIAGCRDPWLEESNRLYSGGFVALALRCNPQQITQQDESGDYPLHIAVSTINRDKAEYVGWSAEHEEQVGWSYEHEVQDLKRANMLKRWKEENCPHHGYEDFEEYVEACCMCCDHNTCIQKGLEKCTCKKDFESGLGPCDCDNDSFEWYFQKMTDEHRNDQKLVIQMLIKEGPEVAGYVDAAGNLPLHRALLSGKHWGGGVQDLVKANPDALSEADPSHKLYPFMLARSDTDTAFELLRACPHVLANLMEHLKMDQNIRRRRRLWPGYPNLYEWISSIRWKGT